MNDLNISWINGKSEEYMIDSSISIISIKNFYPDGEDLFLQGEDADKVIKNLHTIWIGSDLTVDEVILKYKQMSI